MAKKYNKNKKTALEIILVGIFKALWWIVSFPFKRKNRAKVTSSDKQKIFSKRHEIEEIAKSNNIIELKHAVMEADKLVDHVLKLNGYQGQTFAERLRNAEEYLDENIYQSIWNGHKVRNKIAHEQEANFSEQELKNAINNLLIFLKNV